MGAEAAAPNRFAELSTLVATAPSARKTGLSSMIRVSSTVRSAAAGSKPGVISGTRTGAATNASAPRTASARSIRFGPASEPIELTTTLAPSLMDELRWRGMLADVTPGLAERLARGPVSAYNGFDPTAPSLHVGHLVPVFGLLHLQRHGNRPIAVVGGGTGMIGDPSGRSSERQLLDRPSIVENSKALRLQLE